MLSNRPKRIAVVTSEDNAHAVSDWNVVQWCQSLKDGDTAYVATSLMFNELRIAVSRNEIEPFSLEFNGETLHVGDKGEVGERFWPDGFFDHQGIQVKMLINGKSREEVTADQRALKERHKKKHYQQ